MKGQMTIANLMGLFVGIVLFFFLLPVLITIINSSNAYVAANASAEAAPLMISISNLIPVAILIMLLITGMKYAQGQGTEQRY